MNKHDKEVLNLLCVLKTLCLSVKEDIRVLRGDLLAEESDESPEGSSLCEEDSLEERAHGRARS